MAGIAQQNPERYQASIEQTVVFEQSAINGGFTSTPNWLLKAQTLSRDAKLTYIYLLSYAWQKGFCFPGEEALSHDLDASRFSIMRWLKELRDARLIDVRRRGLGLTNIYVIKEPPADVARLQHQTEVAHEQHQEVASVTHLDVARKPHAEVARVPQPNKKTQGKKTQTEKDTKTLGADKPRRSAKSDDYKRISTQDDEAANELRRLALGWARRAMGANTSTEERIALYARCFDHLRAADVPVAKCKAFTLWCESEGWLKDKSRMFSEAIFQRYYGNWVDAGEPLVYTRPEQKRDKTPAHIQREHDYARNGEVDYSHEEQTPCCGIPVRFGHAYDCPHRAEGVGA